MSKKKSALWDYFAEEANDPTFVVCKIVDCKKKISRGKCGSDRSRLSNTGMRGHLRTHHEKEWKEFLEKEKEQDDGKAATEEKMEEANEAEDLGVPIYKLRTHQSRNNFFQQNLPDMMQNQQQYDNN